MSEAKPKRFKRYIVNMISGQYSGVVRLFEYIAYVSRSEVITT